ncbi:amino acid adenylation domain-containing protein [Hymenobacter sp. HMF4947]|uniref:Amino acid adenylation domain-containing protein n=1 Tax=Hymenobacter ginkgonis TaxID=2682976 RepID=A0A7K1TA35_9BACT|nr:polyketide synthase [Hymenobacter ginkgonis]MVN75041.1 amino acid adenylation domain-containing protein [Hymenobacter ginkgonis]
MSEQPSSLSGASVHQLVEQAVAAHGARIALIAGEVELTYTQVNERAERLSQAIRRRAPEETLIGISSSRGLATIIGVLAILKAGKAYLPLDPAYPPQRLTQIVASSGITTCLAPDADTALFAELGLHVLASEADYNFPPAATAAGSQLAYVLYTSGTTGEPKGVCVSHAPLLNLLHWQQGHSLAGPGTRTLQFAPLIFDVSFQEIFATLSTGGTLVLVAEEQRLDLAKLLHLIEERGVNRLFLPFVALQALAEVAVSTQHFPASLQEIMTAGEQLKITPQVEAFFTALPSCTLYNQFGPTECACITTNLQLMGPPASWPRLPTIGQPIANTRIFIVDENLVVLPPGEAGELCVGGACLAEGYLNRLALTAEKFVTQAGVGRLYRTGDLGRYLPDGNIEFLGRRDDQVKIRGHRIELGEVEVALSKVAGIGQAVVVAREVAVGQQQLVAYLVPAAAAARDVAHVRQALAQRLPAYMLPAAYVWLEELPKSASGKVDRKALPPPGRTRPELATLYRRPTTETEKRITQLWSQLLQLDEIGADDNFFELGGNSLVAQTVVAQLLRQHQYVLPITKLYQFPTPSGVAQYLAQAVRPTSPAPQKARLAGGNQGDIAVISMAGRFPGAATVADLWDVLREGRETTSFFTEAELDPSVPARLRTDPRYVRARGIVADADQFDAAFFGLTPKLAEAMDPQQRLFLEIAWEALEQAGYLPATYGGRVGVFAGSGNNTYFLNNVLANPQVVEQLGDFQVMTVNEKDYVASRVAYQLNLTGPAVSVYSACSTSLLAIAQAVQSLRSGQCEVALAGGVSITAPIRSGHLYQEGAMLSRDGHCRSFAADAQGTVFSDGAGVVLLKPLAEAQQDGDTIFAIIKGVGVNNDGAGKGSFTAPNAEGQAGAIRQALADGQVAPATISYVEAHGTATPLGDPIELEGLTMAFGEQAAKQFCALGSIKSNMGHLTAAAGVAGFIKTALALHYQQLPASLGFAAPNPHIDFVNSPFFVNTELRPWAAASARRAGVSSFGVGGTNVHVVLEEHISTPPPVAHERPVQLFAWSAKAAASREGYAQRLTQHLAKNPALSLADAAFTLHTTRPDFAQRRFAVVSNADELHRALQADTEAPATTATVRAVPTETVFLFPGQGSQYLGMGQLLYEREPVYRQAVDECADLLQGQLATDIRQVLYPPAATAAAEQLRDTRYAQPALFVTEYALAMLWRSWGIRPTVLCGHSIGEFVAAHLAGVFSLADALRLVATRGRLVSEQPRGSMLSVRLPAEKLLAILPPALSLAAVNSDKACVVAGPDEAVATFGQLLAAQGTASRALATSHAFHSAMMEPVVDAFRQVVGEVALSRPQLPIVSTVSGTWLTDAQATDPDYWARHLRQTVQFGPALHTLFELGQPLLLEVGPGNVAATLARQAGAGRAAGILPGLVAPAGPQTDYHTLLNTLGQLWLAGLTPDWAGFYAGQHRQKIALPTYAFARQRCWLDPPAAPVTQSAALVAQPTMLPTIAIPLPNLPTPSAPSTMRKTLLLNRVKTILEDASGIEMADVTPEMSFLEIGFDSLLLTQVALTLRKEFALPLTFRQLNEEYATLAQLATYLDQQLPTSAPALPPAPALAAVPVLSQPAPVPVYLPAPSPVAMGVGVAAAHSDDSALGLVVQQLQLLAKQVALMQGPSPVLSPSPLVPVAVPAAPVAISALAPSAAPVALPPAPDLTPEEALEIKKPFGATARIERQVTELGAAQQDFLQQLTRSYTQKTRASKAYAQQHRAHMADPRVVSGFKPLTKEIVYPLVVNKSKGSRLWDIDGNEYIDALNGFGSSMLGYQPDFIKEALHAQIDAGYEVGPQHALAGEVSELICEFTGFERAGLCNTGSEAVLGALRIARTTTGRSLVVAFTGSYHGIVDEVLVRGTKKLKSFPAAAGIMPESVQNMLILDYGTDESLRIIRERAHELAAVLVEPVQSRRPEFRPVAFLRQVRDITAAAGTVLIFDEVITGFRMHPGGAQALFGIKADLAAYGKVVGGGLSIGIIAGRKDLMDALDGGYWQYGDASVPEVGVTYFAGTFVRHPLALAAAKASLQYMQAQGPALQERLTAKTERLAQALNAELERRELPFFVAHFGSLWKVKFPEEVPYSELLFTLMREKGIHIWDGFPCFLTEAHTEAEVDQIVAACLASAAELVAAGFFTGAPGAAAEASLREPGTSFMLSQPPVPGARLGRDRAGNPAWFVADPTQPGSHLQINVN